jgi:hypothetical protein
MGAAIRVFARLSNPEKAAWMLRYNIDWDASAASTTAGARRSPAPAAIGTRPAI